MPCLAASCAVVSSPRSASKATFALKSAEYRVRLPVIRVRPSRRRTELTYLSEIRGPPQRTKPHEPAICGRTHQPASRAKQQQVRHRPGHAACDLALSLVLGDWRGSNRAPMMWIRNAKVIRSGQDGDLEKAPYQFRRHGGDAGARGNPLGALSTCDLSGQTWSTMIPEA